MSVQGEDRTVDGEASLVSSKGTERHFSWKKLASSCNSAPNMRANTSVFYEGDNLWYVCGKSTGFTNEVWAFNITERRWLKKATKGRSPSARDGHAVAFSEKSRKFCLFGGQSAPKPVPVPNNSFDKIKTEFLATRQTLADFFEFDIDSCTWEEKEPSGIRPPARRCHTFLPYKTKDGQTKTLLRGEDILGIQSKHHPSEEEFMIVYGGSGVDPTKGIDRAFNDIWVYDVSRETFNPIVPCGTSPVPTYEHAAVISGSKMIVIGGILPMTTNTSEGIDFHNNRHEHANDLMIFDIESITWFRVELMTLSNKHNPLGVHGHTVMMDPFDSTRIFIFGGKETNDSTSSLTSAKTRSKWMKLHDNPHLDPAFNDTPVMLPCRAVNIVTGVMSSIVLDGADVGNRFGHTLAVGMNYFARRTIDRSEIQNDGSVVLDGEVVGILYGGYNTDQNGFCRPDLYELVYSTGSHRRRKAVSMDRMIGMDGDGSSILDLGSLQSSLPFPEDK